jgi:hypothetical protein
MEVECVYEFLAEENAPRGVPHFVESRGKEAEAWKFVKIL